MLKKDATSADLAAICMAILLAWSPAMPMPFPIAMKVLAVRLALNSDIPNCLIAVFAKASHL